MGFMAFVVPFVIFAVTAAYFIGRRDRRLRLRVLEHVAILTGRGLPLGAGLAALEHERAASWGARARKDARILHELSMDVESHSLSDAFAKHPAIFPPPLVSLVRLAEARGALPATALILAREEQDRDDFAARLAERSYYPIILAGAVVGSGGFVSELAQPKLTEVGVSLGLDPGSLAANAEVATLVLAALTGLGVLALLLVLFDRVPRGLVSATWSIGGALPGLGAPLRRLRHARWLGRVGALVGAGATLPDALEDASRGADLPSARLADAARLAREGKPLQEVLPAVLGAEAGELSALLATQARLHGPGPAFTAMSERLGALSMRRLDAIGQMLRPVPVVLAGGVVALHLLSVFGWLSAIESHTIGMFRP